VKRLLLIPGITLALVACGDDDSDVSAERSATTERETTTTEPEETELEQAFDEVRRLYSTGIAADLETDIGRRTAAGLDVLLHNVEIVDDGHTLTIDGQGGSALLSPAQASGDITYAFLNELDAPESVWAKMSNTRALDGMQDATWDEFVATWTYHPDNGLDTIIEEAE
jgi:hypothetical protein